MKMENNCVFVFSNLKIVFLEGQIKAKIKEYSNRNFTIEFSQ